MYSAGYLAFSTFYSCLLCWCCRSACDAATNFSAGIRIRDSSHSAAIINGEGFQVYEEFSNDLEYFCFKSRLPPGYVDEDTGKFAWSGCASVVDEDLNLIKAGNCFDMMGCCLNADRYSKATMTFCMTPLHAAILVNDVEVALEIISSIAGQEGKREQLSTRGRLPVHMVEQIKTSQCWQMTRVCTPGLDVCDDPLDYPVEMTPLQLAQELDRDEIVDQLRVYVDDCMSSELLDDGADLFESSGGHRRSRRGCRRGKSSRRQRTRREKLNGQWEN